MGLRLLLSSVLLSSYFLPGSVVNAQRVFTIRDITLSIEPSTDVLRDTNVTLRCQAVISSSGQETLSREYTIYKDSIRVYTKTSSSTEDLLYPLPEARVSNSGKYKCSINIRDKQMTSQAKKLTVTGLSKPVLHLNKGVVNEGEELTARCTAPGETGSIFFYFYEDSREILEMQVNTNQAEAKLFFESVGIHRIHCSYIVLISPDSSRANASNIVAVSVKDLSITAILEIVPQHKVFEGDQLSVSCTISSYLPSSDHAHLYLSQGTKLLSSGDTKVNHTLVALAKDPGDFECKLEMANVVKTATKTVSVAELFSEPTLTMSPVEVFQKEYVTLTCKSESYASERLRREELTYTLDPLESLLLHKGNGVFYGKALAFDFNYTCAAQAKGIVKHSKTLTVRPKVSVSTPRMSVVGRAILGRPFKILCQSDTGSLPINYTLLENYEPLSIVSVKFPNQQALFTVTITKAEQKNWYLCEAKNNRNKEGLISKRLSATVIEPLTEPTLTVVPTITEISEGDHLYLICGIKGTPPVTFKWYLTGSDLPLYTTTSNSNNTDYQIPSLSKDHSGTYYCEAFNHANNVVRSKSVVIFVHLAMWKKMVIGAICFLALLVSVVVCVLCFRSKIGKREAAAELSVKPSSPKSDDSLKVNLTHDTEVYNTATVKSDRAAVSVWTKRPPEADVTNDEVSIVTSNEPDVEYTEVVHPQPMDPARVPLRKGTDTVYSELQNSPHGTAEHHGYGSVEYAGLNGEQPEINHYHPEVDTHNKDLPVPVD